MDLSQYFAGSEKAPLVPYTLHIPREVKELMERIKAEKNFEMAAYNRDVLTREIKRLALELGIEEDAQTSDDARSA